MRTSHTLVLVLVVGLFSGGVFSANVLSGCTASQKAAAGADASAINSSFDACLASKESSVAAAVAADIKKALETADPADPASAIALASLESIAAADGLPCVAAAAATATVDLESALMAPAADGGPSLAAADVAKVGAKLRALRLFQSKHSSSTSPSLIFLPGGTQSTALVPLSR